MGITAMSLDPVEDSASPEWMWSVVAYELLAWYEHVEDAQKELPILVITEKEWVSGNEVKAVLKDLSKGEI